VTRRDIDLGIVAAVDRGGDRKVGDGVDRRRDGGRDGVGRGAAATTSPDRSRRRQ